MAEVKLYKKLATYKDKNGEEKTATNFFVGCGDQLIPVEVKFFEDKETGADKNYRVRKTLLSAFAETLPERENSGNKKKAKDESAVDETSVGNSF
ncbi:hypothetical protein [Pumilibacter muris]|uniref:hypothetical protein n=1 Tax=Pumilibacter muris TaxID=2941510 RepID=UPI0020411F8F|nr:hypothetical protein [Pumilibacter muris]